MLQQQTELNLNLKLQHDDLAKQNLELKSKLKNSIANQNQTKVQL